MLKRNTRVFFGVLAREVAPNSHLATLSIALGAEAEHDCSLTYSHNKMDKLTLPMPDNEIGAYDDKVLIFRRLSPNRYTINTLSGTEFAAAKRASSAIGASFRMSGPSSRKWGVF